MEKKDEEMFAVLLTAVGRLNNGSKQLAKNHQQLLDHNSTLVSTVRCQDEIQHNMTIIIPTQL